MATVFDQVVRIGTLSSALLFQEAALPQVPKPEGPGPGPVPAVRVDAQSYEMLGAIKNTLTQLEKMPGVLPDKVRIFTVDLLKSSEKDLERGVTADARTKMNAALENQLLLLNALVESKAKGGPAAVPPVIGVYNAQELAGMRLVARILGPMMEQQMERGGRQPTEQEQRVLRGLSAIGKATDSEDLAKRLEPELAGMAKMLMNPSATDRQQLESLFGFAGALKREGQAADRAAASELNWYREWQKKLAEDPTPRLNRAGREGYERRQFEKLAKENPAVIQNDAAVLAKREGIDPALAEKLTEIADKTKLSLPKDALETMKRASLPELRAK